MSDPVRLNPVPDAPAPNAGEVRMPRNVEAEAALLGALMIDNRIAEDVQMMLGAQHFYEPLHGASMMRSSSWSIATWSPIPSRSNRCSKPIRRSRSWAARAIWRN